MVTRLRVLLRKETCPVPVSATERYQATAAGEEMWNPGWRERCCPVLLEVMYSEHVVVSFVRQTERPTETCLHAVRDDVEVDRTTEDGEASGFTQKDALYALQRPHRHLEYMLFKSFYHRLPINMELITSDILACSLLLEDYIFYMCEQLFALFFK